MRKFQVPDMSCGHCKAAIEKAVTTADTEANLSFDMDGRIVEVTSSLEDSALAAILEDAGYPNTIET